MGKEDLLRACCGRPITVTGAGPLKPAFLTTIEGKNILDWLKICAFPPTNDNEKDFRVKQTPSEFQTGVNYWPARSAMRMWKEFDPGEVREDCARMAEFKLSPVRVFLLWEDFQPEPLRVNTKALNRLVELCCHAGDFGVSVWVTLFTGHMCGANWLPGWTSSPDAGETYFPIITGSASIDISATGVVNPYENPDLRRSQKKLLREALCALRGHPALRCWDLGNDVSNVFRPADPEQGMSWLREMTEEIKLQDVVHPVTCGLVPQDLEEDRGLGPAQAAQCCDLVTINALPANPAWAGNDPDPLLPLFLAEISRWLAGGKPVWISGIGISTGSDSGKDASPTSEQLAAGYAGQSLDALRRHGFPGALLRSCSDYVNRHWGNAPFDTNPQERSCGVFRSDGAPKETAIMLAKADRKPGNAGPPGGWIDVDAEEYRLDPQMHIRRLFKQFRELFP